MGSSGRSAWQRPGGRDDCHQRAAGPAPDPGQAEPDRAHAQRRPRRLHRRRVGDRVAARAAATVGQREGSTRPAGQLCGGRLRAQAGSAQPGRPFPGRCARLRQSSHPDRPAQHRPGGRCARRPPATGRPSPCQSVRSAAGRLHAKMARGDRSLDGTGGAAQGRAGRLAAQGLCLLVRLARHAGSGRARAQARRGAERFASGAGAVRIERNAGANGGVRRLPGSTAVRMAQQPRWHSCGEVAFHRRRNRGAKDLFGLFDDTLARLLAAEAHK